ncbi:unnamed protein product, partial [marine sediment metagenome]
GNLTIIARTISNFSSLNTEFTQDFLGGRRFKRDELEGFYSALEHNCFGQYQKEMSFHYINNHIFQFRNLFFKYVDFTTGYLFNTPIIKNNLQKNIFNTFTILENKNPPQQFIELITNGFIRKKKGVFVSVNPSDLVDYLLNSYFAKIKQVSTATINTIFALHKKIKKSKNKKYFKRQQKRLRLLKIKIKFLNNFIGNIGDIEYNSKKDFKIERKKILDNKKRLINNRLKNINDVKFFVREAFKEEIKSFKQNPNQFVLKRLFKPNFPRITIRSINYASFLKYLKIRLQYKIRENLKELFFSNTSNISTLTRANSGL